MSKEGMTLEEAIEGLRKEVALRLGGNSLKLAMQYGNRKVAPLQLGIEALELIRDLRKDPKGLARMLSGFTKVVMRLPSEEE